MDDAKMSTEQVEETRFAAAQAEFGHHKERILVLQGGGALGAYQAGVYQGLAAAGFAPNWVAGTSIGAINAALVAGNPPDRRVARLSEFWNRVSGGRFAVVPPAGMDFMRPWLNRMSAAAVATFGVAGFFSPRFPPPALSPDGSVGALSFYDTEPLRETLNELVDFDLVNSGKVRLSLGAVNVRTGESIYFDTTTHKINAGHVMASGSLPPGFPPVKIDGEWYWDGGLMSNTPLLHVAQDLRIDALVIQVDLFSGLGDMPTNIEEVCERAKDIQYQSKRRLSMEMMRHLEDIRSTLAEVLEMLPEAKKSDPRVQKLSTVSRRGALSLVHIVNRHDTQSNNFKDYEFSRATVMDLWRAGRDDIHRAMTSPRSGRVTDIGSGVRFFDF